MTAVTEPDVAITDYLLTAETAVLAALLIRQPDARSDLQLWFVVFFAATGLAAALGGTVHGFFAGASRTQTVLWRSTLLAIGGTAAAGWMIGAAILWNDGPPFWFSAFAFLQLAAYALAVLVVTDAFWVAVANYMPSTVFLVIAYAVAYQADHSAALAAGLGGLVLTLAAAAGQRLRIGLHPVYLSHNALYHVLQGVALFLIFWSARYLVVR